MLSYLLCKKLKKAGFSQELKRGGEYVDGKEGIFYVPSLSELIDTCGDDFGGLIKRGEKWSCGERAQIIKDMDFVYDSQEEAVVGLWLKLNQKVVNKK